MKSYLAALVLVLFYTAALADSLTTKRTFVDTFAPETRNKIFSQMLIQEYAELSDQDKKTNGSMLDAVHARGLSKARDNVELLLGLAEKDPREPLILKLIAQQYQFEPPSESNVAILKKLRAVAKSPDSIAARAAMISFSRLGYFSDSKAVLLSGLDRKILAKDEYFGELAHIVWFADEDGQIGIFQEIEDSRNFYASDIIASEFKIEVLRKKLTQRALEKLRITLSKLSPKISIALGEMNMFEAIMYSDWLHAYATLCSDAGVDNYGNVVSNILTRRPINPKKIIAYLSSTEGQGFIREVGRDAVSEMTNIATDFAANLPYPQNAQTIELVDSIVSATSDARK